MSATCGAFIVLRKIMYNALYENQLIPLKTQKNCMINYTKMINGYINCVY